MANVKHFVELANATEINTYVVDIKDDDGYVGYESNVPLVRAIKAWKHKYDADKVLQAFHENHIHVIGRLACFKDPVLSSLKPEWAIKDMKGGVWKDDHKRTWLNPYNKNAWPYVVDIAREAVRKGFDEIQFDYARFPSDGDNKAMNLESNGVAKCDAINGFFAYARKEMPNVVLSADVFGIICESPGDTEKIGQVLESVGLDMDYISPMAYPSHYAKGQIINSIKYPKPDLEPYPVVHNTLLQAKRRIGQVQGYRAKVRPFLQDFTASWLGKGNYQKYGEAQVQQQIKAVYDAGYDEWLVWCAHNKYDESAFQKDEKLAAASHAPRPATPPPSPAVP
jgi:hypothetical protein